MRTFAGFWPQVINTKKDDDEDVLDGSQWHQTINIRPWQENVIGTNDAYFHTVAWYRAWGKIADVNELTACATRWKVPVPCSNVLWNLLLNESAEDILVMLCPPTRVRNTLPTRRSSRAHTWASLRRHWLDELSTTDWAHQNWARHDWAQHDTVWPTDTFDCVDNWYDWTETVLLYELGVYHGNLFSLFQKWNVHLQVAFSWLYRCRSEWLKTRFNVLFVLNFSH